MRRVIVGASLLNMLASCGEGGGSAPPPIQVTPVPAPSPTVSPTPAPVPTPAPAPSPTPTLPPPPVSFALPVREDSTFLAFSADASSGTGALPAAIFPLGGSALAVRFGSSGVAEFIAQGPRRPDRRFGGVRRVADELVGGNDSGSQIQAFANVSDISAASNGVQFRYASYALLSDVEEALTTASSYVFGFVTPSSVLPLSGTRSFSGSLRAKRILSQGQTRTLSDLVGTATVDVDYNTYRVRVRISFGDPAMTFERSVGLGSGANGSNFFSGLLIDASTEPVGNVIGAIWGPGGDEVAFTFNYARTDASSAERIVGVALAK